MTTVSTLPAEALYTSCDPQQFAFETTAELEDLQEIMGQARAIEALHFGVGIKRDGYNLFVLGPSGIGKYTVVRQYLEQKASGGKSPDDWCYVNNFLQSHKPCAIRLPAGKGQILRQDMEHLINELKSTISAAFESEEYQARVREIEEDYKERREGSLKNLAEESEHQGLALIRTPGGFAFAPQQDGEVIKPEAYEKLSAEEKHRIEDAVEVLQKKLGEIVQHTPQWQREAREKVRALDHEVGLFAVGGLIEELRKKYADMDRVLSYLDAIQTDIMDHLSEFRSQ